MSGLPGVGKSTLAGRAAQELGATYLRIDTIEEAIAEAGLDAGSLGYTVSYALARDQLSAGRSVVADGVHAVGVTRVAWRRVAAAADAAIAEVEIVCSDRVEHRMRVEARLTGGKTRPTWADVTARPYEAWTWPVHRIDTAGSTQDACLDRLMAIASRLVNEKAPPGEPAGPF